MGEIIQFDHQLLLFFNGLHCELLDSFMMLCSNKWVWIPFYVWLFSLLVRSFGWRKAFYGLLAVAVTITLCDQVSSSLIRPLVCRLRPANPENPLSAMVHIVDGYRGGRYGFPSSHAANTAGLSFFFIWLFRKRWLTVLMLSWMTLVCYSRVYLGVHYPGDLFVGACIGAVVGTAVVRLCHHMHLFPRDGVGEP
jgi:undecaprenyl-diphosphatase